MKMNIPEIGDTFVLTEDWTFKLFCEHRNQRLLSVIGMEVDNYGWSPSIYPSHAKNNERYRKHIEEQMKIWKLLPVYADDNTIAYYDRYVDMTIPSGTELKIDRIYIRKGLKDYSSVSFYATINKKKCRFWAKLSDVNNIVYI